MDHDPRPLDCVDLVRTLNAQADPPPWSDHKYQRPPRGGTKSDAPVIGGAGGCWCGGPDGHTWPGQGEGAPHPR